jgi:hypothetical protein
VVSATLVARTVTVCAEAIDAGAVYRPLVLMVPTDGLRVHVTPVLLVPVTVAVNCCAWPWVRVAAPGDTETATPGCSVTVAVAYFVVSAVLVARTVTVCVDVIDAGAEYRPEDDMVPTAGERDHVT